MVAKIRLYVEHPLGQGQSVPLTRDQAHYLFGVMRLGVGGAVALFNGRDGEWQGRVAEAGKRGGALEAQVQSRPQIDPPDVWLLFAPVKKARTDFIVEKAVELGAARICPVLTEFTNAERVRRDRLQAHAVEAAEQCGATFVPQVADAVRLDRVLADWDAARRLMFCNEATAGRSSVLADIVAGGAGEDARKGGSSGPWAILIGPEGGFSASERTRLTGLPYARTVSLGPRILRADTAAVAALTLWQQALGDWQ